MSQENEFVDNRMIRYAVERQLIVIGEAANQFSKKFHADHPEIPWRQMVRERNCSCRRRWR